MHCLTSVMEEQQCFLYFPDVRLDKVIGHGSLNVDYNLKYIVTLLCLYFGKK